MNDAPLALAFTAGMLATVNPCGFAMLPAYLSYFVGLEAGGDGDSAGGAAQAERSVWRALAVSAVMTAGFVAVFGLMGLVIVQVSSRVQSQLPWVTIAIGISLVGLGVAAVTGHPVMLRLPKVQQGAVTRELPSMLVFGVSYALSSLSCTIGPFLAATSSTFTGAGVVAGTATFATYGLGMGAVVTLLTVAVALARTGVIGVFRRVLRHVNTLSGLFMIVAGAYVAYYGVYEIRLRSTIARDPVVDAAQTIQSWLASLLDGIGALRLGVASAVMVLLALTVTRLARHLQSTRHPARTKEVTSPTAQGADVS